MDNNSSDGSVKLVKEKYPVVEVLEMEDNFGFAKGNNNGIKHAFKDPNVEYVVLLNTDAVLADNWTETVVDFANKKPRGAAFQTITLDYYDHNIIDSTHIYVSQNGQGTQGSWRRPIAKNQEVAPHKVFGCNAAAVMYSRKFIEAQPFDQFFDETMFMYLEDVDVAARATVMGWDNYVVPESRAYHMGSASSGKNPGFSLYLTFRNNSGMLIKNFPLSILIKIYPKLVRGDYETIKHLIKQKKYHAVTKVIKGRLAGVIYVPIFILKRRKLKAYRIIDTKILWLMMARGFIF